MSPKGVGVYDHSDKTKPRKVSPINTHLHAIMAALGKQQRSKEVKYMVHVVINFVIPLRHFLLCWFHYLNISVLLLSSKINFV